MKNHLFIYLGLNIKILPYCAEAKEGISLDRRCTTAQVLTRPLPVCPSTFPLGI